MKFYNKIGKSMNIKYKKLDEINENTLLNLVNNLSVRKHLISHPSFDINMLNLWIKDKIEMDSLTGCKIRAIVVDGKLAGWCGIQLEKNKYEMAIILDNSFWGIGKKVFFHMMKWAKDFGHTKVYINFLHTRNEYKFLQKIATNISKSTILGEEFTSYEITLTDELIF
jgi:hypothetical protein